MSSISFIDDTWKVTPKLTLSLGLRYELTPPFTNTKGDYFTVKIPQIDFTPNQPQANWPFFVRQEKGCTDPYQGLSIHWTSTNAVCGGGLNNNLRQTKYNNFARGLASPTRWMTRRWSVLVLASSTCRTSPTLSTSTWPAISRPAWI
jgi:hypothetical protein